MIRHPSFDPSRDLYGRILFHRGRFCRLKGYRLLKAKECVAELSGDDDAAWFGPYLPSPLLLGNPAARDAALHGLDAPTRQQIVATALVGSALLDQELDRGLDRLSADEQREFIRLQLKIEGRLIEAETPPADAESSEPESSDPGMAEPAIDERTFKKSG